jgi:hypothetical protein
VAAAAATPLVGIDGGIVFWASSVLIDVDHYVDFVYRSRFSKWSIREMYDFHRGLFDRIRDGDFLAISLCHTLEWFLLVWWAARRFQSALLVAAFWGMVFHVVLDLGYLARLGALTTRALSVSEYLVRRRGLIRSGRDPDRVYRDTLADVDTSR